MITNDGLDGVEAVIVDRDGRLHIASDWTGRIVGWDVSFGSRYLGVEQALLIGVDDQPPGSRVVLSVRHPGNRIEASVGGAADKYEVTIVGWIHGGVPHVAAASSVHLIGL
jgi:hypothetical protein